MALRFVVFNAHSGKVQYGNRKFYKFAGYQAPELAQQVESFPISSLLVGLDSERDAGVKMSGSGSPRAAHSVSPEPSSGAMPPKRAWLLVGFSRWMAVETESGWLEGGLVATSIVRKLTVAEIGNVLPPQLFAPVAARRTRSNMRRSASLPGTAPGVADALAAARSAHAASSALSSLAEDVSKSSGSVSPRGISRRHSTRMSVAARRSLRDRNRDGKRPRPATMAMLSSSASHILYDGNGADGDAEVESGAGAPSSDLSSAPCDEAASADDGSTGAAGGGTGGATRIVRRRETMDGTTTLPRPMSMPRADFVMSSASASTLHPGAGVAQSGRRGVTRSASPAMSTTGSSGTLSPRSPSLVRSDASSLASVQREFTTVGFDRWVSSSGPRIVSVEADATAGLTTAERAEWFDIVFGSMPFRSFVLIVRSSNSGVPTVTHASPSTKRVLGSSAALIGTSFFASIHPDDVDMVRALRTDEDLASVAPGTDVSFRLSFRRARGNGSYLPVAATLFLRTSDHGAPATIFASLEVDNTSPLLALASARRLTSLVASLDVGVLLLSRLPSASTADSAAILSSTVCLTINTRMTRLLQIDCEEPAMLSGVPLGELGADDPVVAELVPLLQAGETVRGRELSLESPDGSVRYFRMDVVAIIDGEYMVTCQDVTPEKQLLVETVRNFKLASDRATDKIERQALQEFLRCTSHDIRTPLQGVTSAALLLHAILNDYAAKAGVAVPPHHASDDSDTDSDTSSGSDVFAASTDLSAGQSSAVFSSSSAPALAVTPTPAHALANGPPIFDVVDSLELVDIISASAQLVDMILSNVLDVEAIKHGGMELELAPCNLRPRLQALISVLRYSTSHKAAVVLNVDLPAFIPPLHCDGDRVLRVLMNLLVNAIKFTERGSVKFSVTYTTTAAREVTNEPGSAATPMAVVTFTIADTGCGMTHAELAQVGSLYAHKDIEQGGGSGIGLFNVVHSLRVMDSRLSISSEPGAGTRVSFSLDLPIQLMPASDNGDMADAHHAPAPPVLSLTGTRAPGVASPTAPTALPISARRTAPFRRKSVSQLLFSTPPASRFSHSTPSFGLAPIVETGGDNDTDNDVDVDEDLSAASQPLTPSAAPQPRPIAMSVLFVEDNVINRKVGKRLLERMGHTVATAEDGGVAIAMLCTSTVYDLVFMDISMPVLRGTEVTAQFRVWEADAMAADTTRPYTPIYALTGNVTEQDRDACYSAGCDGFLCKPCVPATLQRAFTEVRANLVTRPSKRRTRAPDETAVPAVGPSATT